MIQPQCRVGVARKGHPYSTLWLHPVLLYTGKPDDVEKL
jgi:hypothetical protein